jgi:preprotein translocase subunit SecD
MKGKQGQTRGKTWLIFAGIIILAVFCALVIFPNLPSYIPGASFFNKFTPKLGLDLQGGVHLVYQADTSGVAGDEIDERWPECAM